MSKPEEKIVFAVSTDHGSESPVIVLGISKAAWNYMKDGNTHTFDLTKVGLPVKLILFGAETHEAASKILLEDLAKKGIKVNDQRDKTNFSV